MNTEHFEAKTAALQDEERARLLLCMVRYEASGEEMELPGNERFIWPVFRLEIDQEKEAAEREAQEKAQRRALAKKAAETRWNPPCDTEPESGCNADACAEMRTHADASGCIADAFSEEKEKRTKKEKEEDGVGKDEKPPKPPRKSDAAPGFEAFWNAYPRQDAKKAALTAWNKLAPDEALLNAILRALEQQRASPQWTKDGGQYIPLPAVWLNGRRWEDKGVIGIPSTGKTVSAQNYGQRVYTEEELNSISSMKLLAEAQRKGGAAYGIDTGQDIPADRRQTAQPLAAGAQSQRSAV